MGKKQTTFSLKYSPDFGLFEDLAGEDPIDQVEFGASRGFTAWESTGLMQRPVEEQERISKSIQRLDMEFGQFIGHRSFAEVTFAGDNEEIRSQVLQDIRDSVEVAKRMNTGYVHVVLGQAHPRLRWGYQMGKAVELLKQCAKIYEAQDLTMIIEPMNHLIDHPKMFLHTVSQAYELCKAVGSPSCKILFDIYHVQIQEGNIIPNIDLAWDEIGYFQIGDTPGRNEPTTGEIDYGNVFQHICEKGYEGFLGMEHGTAKSGKEGERAVLEAYRAVDPS